MKSAPRSPLLQVSLLALVLGVIGYLAWHRYQRPSPPTYEGKTLDQWVEDLDDLDYHTSARAADVLADAGAEALPLLLDAYQRGEIRLHRRAAAVLVRFGVRAAPALASALKDKAQQPPVEIVLVHLGPAAVPALREAITEDRGCEAAAHVLGLIGPRAADAVPDLIAVLKRGQAPALLRSEVIFALGRIGEPSGDVVPALIAALKDSSGEVREQAADALGWIGAPARQAAPALTAALKNADAKTAIKACRALSGIEVAESAPALLAAFQDTRAEVAIEAGRALCLLGPKADAIVPALLSAGQGPHDKSAETRGLLATFGSRVVPVLVKALGDGKAERREAAADTLGRIGPPARIAVPALLAALKDRSTRVALMAAMALAEIDPTRSAPAVPLLADALDVPGAVAALAKIGPDARAAMPALIAALKPHQGNALQEPIRLNARLALARIGAPAVPALIEALQDKREGVAALAGEALGWILPPPKQAVPALRAALRNDRAHAIVYARSLGQLGPLAKSAIPDLSALLADAANRLEAAVALVSIDPRQAEKVVPLLIKDLQAEDEKQRQAAVLALARLGPAAQPAADALVALLRDRLLNETEINALSEIWTRAVPAVAGLLEDPQAEIRQQGMLALGQIGPAARPALASLIAALSDRKSGVQAGAARIMQALGPQANEAIPALIANLQARQPEVRASAALALGHIEAQAKQARQSLVECLLDPDKRVRYAAALSLGRIDPDYTEAVPALHDASNDSAPLVQLAAIDSLGRIEPAARKVAAPILIFLSQKPYPLEVRFRAVEGLTNLLGPEEAKQAIPWLTIELTDGIPENRLHAARLLANIDRSLTPDLVLALAAVLSTPFADRRPILLKTLAEFGPKAREAVPEIERLLFDGTPGVRPEAIRALRAINPARLKQLGLE